MKSSFERTWKFCSIKKVCSAAWLLRSARIFSISSCSFNSNSRISLFSLTTDVGSIKRVEPVADWSCSIPGKDERYSAFTGRQYLPLRIVIRLSCNMERAELFRIAFNCSWILSPVRFNEWRILDRPALASSAISSSAGIHRRISFIKGKSGSIFW